MIYDLGKSKGKQAYFNTEDAKNDHVIGVGSSGSGKTTFFISLINQISEQNGTVVVFDMHDVLAENQIHPALREEFKKYLNEIDVHKDGLSFPLFTPMTFADGTFETDSDLIESITKMISTVMKFKVRQNATLKAAVRTVYHKGTYAEKGISALNEVLEETNTNKSLEVAERISALTGCNLFHEGKFFIERGKINVLRLSKFSFEVQRIISEIVLSLLWRMAALQKFHDNGLYLFVDEAHNLDMGKNSILGQILREGRKYNLSLLISTQLLGQGEVSQLMMQAGLVLFFETARNETDHIAKLIEPRFADDWRNILRKLGKGEFAAVGPISLDVGNIQKKPIVVSGYLGDKDN